MKYDFLVFENYHLARNHKYDVILIGKLLRYAGLKVAILDIYGEDNDDIIEELPVLHLNITEKRPDDNYQRYPKNKFFSFLASIRFLYQQHRFMCRIVKEIEPLADRFYCGSYHTMISSQLLSISKPCYYWGLRSSRMTDFWTHFKHNPLLGFHAYLLKNKFLKTKQNLFVSNEIIKDEFVRLGIPTDRLIIREERCIERLGDFRYEKLNERFTILTIGMLRPDKRIEYTIDEFISCAKNENWRYVLAGKSQGDYELGIIKHIGNNNCIVRKNEYMNYDKFNNEILESHFVLLADKQQRSSVTNGTMMEALINYRPIIAPNYNPYKYYIEKYGIGIMFNPDIPNDLSRAINDATMLGCQSFKDNIDKFLRTIEFKSVAQDLYRQIYKK